MLNAQFFTDTGQHREKNEDAGGIFYNQTLKKSIFSCTTMLKKMKITEVWVQRSFVPSFMTNKLL